MYDVVLFHWQAINNKEELFVWEMTPFLKVHAGTNIRQGTIWKTVEYSDWVLWQAWQVDE